MPNRRLVSLIAAVTAAGLAATACSEQAAAVQVDDVTVSRPDFEDELDLYYDNDDLRTFVFGEVAQEDLRGELGQSFTQDYVAAVAGLRVQFIVAELVLADQGLELTDEARAEAEQLIAQQVPGGVSSVPEDRRDAFIDDVATFSLLQGELGQEGFSTAMTDAFAAADISVRTQYGEWDPEQIAVVPPAGPVAPGGGDDAGDGADTAPTDAPQPEDPSAG